MRDNRSNGFTLIEMSIVMAIMGLVLAGATSLMSGRAAAERKKLTETRLDTALEALTAYYVVNNRLPCPADGSLTNADANYGRSQPETSGACDTVAVTMTEAVIPWRTLGLREPESFDAWDRRARYWVSNNLTSAGSALSGDLVLRDGDAGNPLSSELANNAAFVLLSSGENGLGGWTRSGTAMATTGISTDEQLNVNGGGTWIDRRLSSLSSDEFDDLVRWQSKARLTQASGAAFSGNVCTSATTLSSTTGCSSGSTDDACIVSEAILARCS